MGAGLTSELVDAWHAQGYLVLRGVFTPAEVAAWHAESDRLLGSNLVHEDNWRTRFRTTADGQRIVEKFDPVVDVSPVLNRVARDERILEPLRQIFEDEPRLFKDKLIFKPAGAEGYGVHQDYSWWLPFPSEKLVSVMVAVDGAGADNGPLEVVPGRFDRHLTPGEMRGITAAECEQFGLTDWRPIETEAGDIAIFHCLTPHRSGRNTSPRSRRQFYPTYAAASYGDLYDAHYRHYLEYVKKGLSEEERGRLFLR